jgi:hypothetical protein
VRSVCFSRGRRHGFRRFGPSPVSTTSQFLCRTHLGRLVHCIVATLYSCFLLACTLLSLLLSLATPQHRTLPCPRRWWYRAPSCLDSPEPHPNSSPPPTAGLWAFARPQQYVFRLGWLGLLLGARLASLFATARCFFEKSWPRTPTLNHDRRIQTRADRPCKPVEYSHDILELAPISSRGALGPPSAAANWRPHAIAWSQFDRIRASECAPKIHHKYCTNIEFIVIKYTIVTYWATTETSG